MNPYGKGKKADDKKSVGKPGMKGVLADHFKNKRFAKKKKK